MSDDGRNGGGESEFQDETLECRDCNAEFTFTAEEQNFFKEKGLLVT